MENNIEELAKKIRYTKYTLEFLQKQMNNIVSNKNGKLFIDKVNSLSTQQRFIHHHRYYEDHDKVTQFECWYHITNIGLYDNNTDFNIESDFILCKKEELKNQQWITIDLQVSQRDEYPINEVIRKELIVDKIFGMTSYYKNGHEYYEICPDFESTMKDMANTSVDSLYDNAFNKE